jgi:hypothetical protein
MGMRRVLLGLGVWGRADVVRDGLGRLAAGSAGAASGGLTLVGVGADADQGWVLERLWGGWRPGR